MWASPLRGFHHLYILRYLFDKCGCLPLQVFNQSDKGCFPLKLFIINTQSSCPPRKYSLKTHDIYLTKIGVSTHKYSL